MIASRLLSDFNKLQRAKPADDVNSGKGGKPNLALGMSRCAVGRGQRPVKGVLLAMQSPLVTRHTRVHVLDSSAIPTLK